ncbi:LOW QUALITY PROTEIN: ankyrin repeat domain-containing protein 53 [Lycodopsis pacificus]
MEPVNKSGKRKRGRCNNWTLTHGSPPDGRMFPAAVVERPEKLDDSVSRQGLSELHEAFTASWLRCSSWWSPGRSGTTDPGTTPLHLAASEGLLDCTETLMRAGADVLAQDSMGHTLDVARIWCHRKVARYLKNCMWQEDKKKEMQERKLVQTLYSDLVDVVKLNDLNEKTLDEKTAEWANKKGFPLLKDLSPRDLVSQYHTQCLASDQNTSHPQRAKQPLKQQREGPPEPRAPPASSSRPWTVFTGLQPEKPLREPDLRDQVTVWRDGGPHYTTTKWDGTRRPAPDVALDILERVLFPRSFPSRIASPRCFEPQDIVEVQHRGHPQGRSTSPWTEVAMHLPEVLEPGHY